MKVMNPADHFQKSDQGAPEEGPWTALAERAVIGHCMIRPHIIGEMVAQLRTDDIQHEVHQTILRALATFAEDGRNPSIHALLTVLPESAGPGGPTMRTYLAGIMAEVHDYAPWKDSLETVADLSRRRRIGQLGSEMVLRHARAPSAMDLATDAITELDDLLTYYRRSKRFEYTAEAAGAHAIAMLDDDAVKWPTTGLADLDRMIGGWPLAQLSIVAGRPGMGKSAVLTSIALGAAKAGESVAKFSLEMTQQQIGARWLTDLAYTSDSPLHYEDVLNRRIDARGLARLQAAQARLAGLPIDVEEQRALTVSEIASRARKIATRLDRSGRRLRLVIVDHLGLVRATNANDQRHRQLAAITDGLATLAKELDCAVVAACQLNRGVEGREDKRPGLADLRESGAIEEDASVVMFAYRPAYYLERLRFDNDEQEVARIANVERAKFDLELGVAKNRNGRVGLVKVFCDIGANAIRNSDYR